MIEPSILSKAIEILGSEINVLPATGGAVEYLHRPDADEIDDALLNAEIDHVREFAEDPAPSRAANYIPVPPLPRPEKHLFRYFIDGSLRTYFLGTGIERERTFPIELAQIGAACVYRHDDGSLSLLPPKTKILLLAPKGNNGISDGVWDQLSKLNVSADFEIRNINEETVHTKSGKEIDPRTRAGGIARNQMHKIEIAQIKQSEGRRNADSWLILDGAVKIDEFIKAPYLIGVAKSFDKKPRFHFGKGQDRDLDVTGLLARLDYAHRTPAFLAHGGQVAFWYVRLWEQKELDYPLMGVVKVELPTPDRRPVSVDLVNLLSRALVAERNVTPYGKDTRWHCHLYPIYCAERAIKDRFMSQEVLMGHIRWHRQIRTST